MRTTKTSLLSIVLMLIVSTIYSFNVAAQDNEDVFEKYRQMVESKFNSTKIKHDKTFNAYRDSINNAFSVYLKNEWEQTSLSNSRPIPNKPEPKPVIDTSSVITSNTLPHVEPEPEVPITVPTPIVPIIETDPATPPVTPEEPSIIPNVPIQEELLFTFNFYGSNCKVNLPIPKELTLSSTSYEAISSVWEELTSSTYDAILNDCINYRKELQLCDWGLYQFILAVSESYFGDADSNEAVMFQMYTLSQLGYKLRLGMQGNRLISLIAFQEQLFAAPYLIIENEPFYFLRDGLKDEGIQICDFKFPNESGASVHIANLPNLPSDSTPKRTIRSIAYPHVSASISVNRNLINFMDTYPCCSWELFAEASLSKEVKEQLYPSLKKTIANLSEKDAANILLNLVQTGFEYKTDDEQFGREKTFFGDEPFFYPYCDCEDRSILYAILVKDLLQLEVVLLDYPSHIATAVCFNENIPGDYFNLDGKKYIICDPTYIGAPIGKSMPDMLNIEANILRIQ